MAGLPVAWTEVCMGHSLKMLVVVTKVRKAAGKDGLRRNSVLQADVHTPAAETSHSMFWTHLHPGSTWKHFEKPPAACWR